MESDRTDSLVPQLREAELTLRRALAEACLAKPPSAANTGELIRIEEVLQLAGEAARRAIRIRRRRRLEETQRTERTALADAEAVASPGATHRGFTDSDGVTWDVFAVHPVAGPSLAQLKGRFQKGWLCFDSVAEKRRLSPIPPAWPSVSDQGLEQLSRRADVAPTRRRRPGQDSHRGDTRASGL